MIINSGIPPKSGPEIAKNNFIPLKKGLYCTGAAPLLSKCLSLLKHKPDRIEGTSAAVAISIIQGANIVRVHDVKEMAKVAKVADAIKRERVTSPY